MNKNIRQKIEIETPINNLNNLQWFCPFAAWYLHVAHDVSSSHAPRSLSRQHETCRAKCHPKTPVLDLKKPVSELQEDRSIDRKMASDEFRLVSPAINHEGRLPRKYTWEGQGALKNLSPPLEWYNVPDGTKTLALVVQDIDAPDPSGPIVPWTIWVVVNIPPTLKRLPEGFSGKEEELGGEYAGIKEGHTDWKVPG